MDWQDYNYLHWQQFMQTAHDPMPVQAQILQGFLQKNAPTLYGRKFNFAQISDYTTYQKKLPIVEEWTTLVPYIQDIANGKSNVLTTEKLIGFEATSGSSFQSKWIPFTSTFQKSFEKAVAVWMYDLYQSKPEVFKGRAFWSVSPVLKNKQVTAAGLPIGLDNDLAYFQPKYAALVATSLVHLPQKIFETTQKETFYWELLVALTACSNLSFISLWSPTFFLMLDEFLRTHFEAILKYQQNNGKLSKARLKILELWQAKRGTWQQLWPQLSCLSCWTDAQSTSYISKVKAKLGNVFIQPKGLIATEGISTLPLANGDRVAAFHSHFFEYRQVDNQKVFLLHQLQKGTAYEVILTNGSGLYRYATKDVVKVVGHFKALPILEFQGRLNTYDLVGEKLSENQIIEALKPLKKALKREIFVSWSARRYVFYIVDDRLFDKYGMTPINDWNVLSRGHSETIRIEKTENQLCRNPYYQQALATGQLKPLQFRFFSKKKYKNLVKRIKAQKQIQDGDFKPIVCVEPQFIKWAL